MKRRTLVLTMSAVFISFSDIRAADASGEAAPIDVHFDNDDARRLVVTRRDGKAISATIEQRLYREGRLLEKQRAGRELSWKAIHVEGVEPDIRPEGIDLPIARELSDGYYVEQIRVAVIVEGADRPVPVRVYRYYSIKKGQRTPLTVKQYSAATTTEEQALDARGRKYSLTRGAAVKRAFERQEPQKPELLELNDEGPRPWDRSEAGEK